METIGIICSYLLRFFLPNKIWEPDEDEEKEEKRIQSVGG